MALKVIGAGLGRTGTKSMQTALNMLGFGPCHHMVEVFAHPDTVPLWLDAAAGKANWDAIFDSYHSVVDYPGAAYWREITSHYPDAKVVLSIRDADEWFDSTQATIFAPNSMAAGGEGPLAPFFASFVNRVAGGSRERLRDRAFMTGYFRRHSDEVVAAFPKERLLVYRAGEGWERLCAFLGVAVPQEPYPSENSRAEFIKRVAAHSAP